MGSKFVQVTTPDGIADAFVAYPEGEGRHPGVLFLMDAIGPRPVLRDMARTIADDGFYVLLPNLFYRTGPAPLFELEDLLTPEGGEALMSKVIPLARALTPDLALPDTLAYLEFLAAQPEVAEGPLGVTGYCMGGKLALQTAAAYPDRVAAAASFHGGRLATDGHDSPHREVGTVAAELYFGHAEDDGSMTSEQVARLEEALDAAGVRYRSEVYPGTKHGFTMSDTAVYDPAGLERHWRNLLELFERTLI
jgi:carboxymethylenebutenolidase